MPYKVIQWATGAVGTWALREIISNPGLELVGVRVFDPAKAGKDAGELAGMPLTGVRATDRLEDILAIDADVVIHTSQPFGDMEAMHRDIIALLESGKDVISTAFYMAPHLHGEAFVKRLEDACRIGGSTLHGTGVNPGILCDRLAATLTGLSMDITQIRTLEAADLRGHPNAGMVIDLLGFGRKPEEFSIDPVANPDLAYCAMIFPEAQYLLFKHLNLTLDRVEPQMPQLIPATKDLQVASGTIAKGTIAGITWEFFAYRPNDLPGKPFSIQRWSWYVESGLPGMPDCDGRYQARVDIDGSPTINNVTDFTDSKGGSAFLPTAAVAINAIPEVVAAAPGHLIGNVFAPWRR